MGVQQPSHSAHTLTCHECSYHFHVTKGQEENEVWLYIFSSFFKLPQSVVMGTITNILVFSYQGERDNSLMCPLAIRRKKIYSKEKSGIQKLLLVAA